MRKETDKTWRVTLNGNSEIFRLFIRAKRVLCAGLCGDVGGPVYGVFLLLLVPSAGSLMLFEAPSNITETQRKLANL